DAEPQWRQRPRAARRRRRAPPLGTRLRRDRPASGRLTAMLLHEILDLAASTSPDTEALVSDGRRLTFAELDQRVRHMSSRLASLTSPGDRVVVVADNTVDAAVALYAVPRCGAALAPANTRHTPYEIA